MESLSENRKITGKPQLPESGRISTWHYDSIGRLVRAVSDGHSYEYIYDEYGNLKEKRSNGKRLISYTHNAAGQITEIKDPADIVTKYEYDIMGRQSRVYNDNGLEVHYGYDALDRISHDRQASKKYGEKAATPDLDVVVHVYDFRMTLNETVKYIEQNIMPDRFMAYDNDLRSYAFTANGITYIQRAIKEEKQNKYIMPVHFRSRYIYE
ncbi:MAG: hypothetical protein K2N90_11265 [Lachnospiraceae bacterium]|nr:hypothetical protein [Lachnospiraceae bacterium]